MPLLIAGMHRSGTSLTASYLQRRGLDLGESLIGAGAGNRFGHFEDRDVHRFHERVLKKNRVSVFPQTDANLPLRLEQEDLAEAREIVERRSAGRPWGWKEPRTTLFLDFWAEFLPEARFLLLFRHPLAVVDSLVRRGTEKEIRWRPVIGLRAWRIYNEQALRFARSQPERAMVVEIESVIQSPERFNEELDRKFELGLRPVPFGTVFSNGEFASGVPKGLGLVKLFHRSELNRALDCYRELLRVSAPIASPSAPITRQAF
ncbi:MAG TPA: sulfotransferase [Longimicrobiaceae bacterium]